MWIQQGGGEHDGLIQEVEDLLTDTEGTLGRLEDHLGFYDAQVLLSTIVQVHPNAFPFSYPVYI